MGNQDETCKLATRALLPPWGLKRDTCVNVLHTYMYSVSPHRNRTSFQRELLWKQLKGITFEEMAGGS